VKNDYDLDFFSLAMFNFSRYSRKLLIPSVIANHCVYAVNATYVHANA